MKESDYKDMLAAAAKLIRSFIEDKEPLDYAYEWQLLGKIEEALR